MSTCQCADLLSLSSKWPFFSPQDPSEGPLHRRVGDRRRETVERVRRAMHTVLGQLTLFLP